MKNASRKSVPSKAPRKLTSLKGATSVEYGILAGLVGIVAIVALTSTGTWVADTYHTVAAHLAGEEGPEGISEEDVAGQEPEGPKGPYDDFFDPETFLIGTPDVDNLDMGDGGPYAGVMALELEDDIVDTTADEIIIPGPGNDILDHKGGSDTYVYARGDGYDYVPFVKGNFNFEFPDHSFTEATFIVNSDKLTIGLPDGEIRTHMTYLTNDGVRNPIRANFKDREFDEPGIRAKAVEDAKPTGNVYLTPYDEEVVHRATTDGSYRIRNRKQGDHTLRFSQTTYDQSRFRVVNYVNDLRIYTLDDEWVDIEYHTFKGLTGTIDRIEFSDGKAPTIEETINKAAEDGKAWGQINLTNYDETMFHRASADKSYHIDGSADGLDTLAFTDTAYDEARFRLINLGHDLAVYALDDEFVSIRYHTHPSLTGKVDEISFSDGKIPTLQETVDKAAEDGKEWKVIHLSEFGENLKHAASIDGTYRYAGQKGGTDTLTFAETAYDQARFRATGFGRDLAIYTPDDDYVEISYHLFPDLTGVVDNIVFADGKSPTMQETVDKAAHDGKAWGAVVLSDYSENITHRASRDPSYRIQGLIGGTDVLTFAETTWPEAAFTDDNPGNHDLSIHTPGGDKITIKYFLYAPSRG